MNASRTAALALAASLTALAAARPCAADEPNAKPSAPPALDSDRGSVVGAAPSSTAAPQPTSTAPAAPPASAPAQLPQLPPGNGAAPGYGPAGVPGYSPQPYYPTPGYPPPAYYPPPGYSPPPGYGPVEVDGANPSDYGPRRGRGRRYEMEPTGPDAGGGKRDRYLGVTGA